MNNVVNIDDQRPHCVFIDPVTKNVHVVPMSLVEDWARGKREPDPESVRAIITDWMADRCDSSND